MLRVGFARECCVVSRRDVLSTFVCERVCRERQLKECGVYGETHYGVVSTFVWYEQRRSSHLYP